MNDQAIRNQIFQELNRKGTIANGNVVRTLMNKVNVSGPKGEKVVRDVIASIQSSGQATVVRDGESITRITLKPNDRRRTTEKMDRCERNDYPAGTKKEMIWAKGVSSHLSDEQCSEVVVITKEEREKAMATPNDMPVKIQPASKVEEGATTSKLPFLELLNLAWTGLRCRADLETGALPKGSVTAFIAEDLAKEAPSDYMLNKLNWTLGQLGLRSTVVLGSVIDSETGKRVIVHQSSVNPRVDIVTQERLDSLTTASEPAEEVSDEVVAEPVMMNVANDNGITPNMTTSLLVGVIKKLEEANADLDAFYKRAKADNERLERELSTARGQISDLTDQVAKLTAGPVDPEVILLLEKYNLI